MNDQKQVYRKRPVLLLLAGGLMGVLLSVESAHAIAGQCKDMTIKFVNKTGLTITIPSDGYKVKNPGGLEGWNNMTLGGSINNLPTGSDRRQ